VAGFKFLDATVGVPDNATNTSGNATTLSFFKNGSTTQLSPPIVPALGQPQKIHLNLQGSVQVEIACTTNANALEDVALGNATLSG
jgi:hypothetical protein